MSALETARDQSLLMPSRWGLRDAPKVLDFAGGLSATFLSAQPGEVCSPPTEAHIVSLVTRCERHHRMWRDGKVITDGTLPSSSVNIVAAGIAPRAVISDPIDVLHVYVPAARLKDEAERAGGLGAGNFEIVDPLYRPDASLTAVLGAIARSIVGRTGRTGCGWTAWGQLSPRAFSNAGRRSRVTREVGRRRRGVGWPRGSFGA